MIKGWLRLRISRQWNVIWISLVPIQRNSHPASILWRMSYGDENLLTIMRDWAQTWCRCPSGMGNPKRESRQLPRVCCPNYLSTPSRFLLRNYKYYKNPLKNLISLVSCPFITAPRNQIIKKNCGKWEATSIHFTRVMVINFLTLNIQFLFIILCARWQLLGYSTMIMEYQ